MNSNVDLAYKLFGSDSVSKALRIKKRDVSHYDTLDRGKNDLVHIFRVNSQRSSYYYDVNVITRKNEIISFYCECDKFHSDHSCKHVAACLINCSSIIFDMPSSVLDISNNILEMFKNDFAHTTGIIKERVNLDLELDFAYKFSSFKLSIGINKMYTINRESKFQSFMSSYLSGDEYYFGVGFTFNPSLHFLSHDDEKLLEFLYGYSKSSYKYNPFELNERELSSLFNLLKGKRFIISGCGTIYDIKYELPTSFNLRMVDSNYELSINDYHSYKFLNKSYKYVVYNHVLFIIPSVYSNLLNAMNSNDVNCLIFDKNNVDLFKKGLLQSIKNNIVISDDVSDIVITGEPDVSLYFDLNRDMIGCKIEFNYNGNIVNYFDDKGSIVRDNNFENIVVTDLALYHFVFGVDSILLIDTDDIGYFLSEGIDILSKKYRVFTSKKIDNVNILRKSNISSNFSIGSDGIMSYNFSTDNIDMDELDKVLSSLRKNKRYYRLKNGNIIDLNNNTELQELSNIFSDLELSCKGLSGSASIPKYRALYIDSLMRNKYKSIRTSNSFDMFIDNFMKYRDVSISFGSDSNILRDYQKDGVKWLYTLYKCDLGGILADEMGLGKSLQTICFIKQVLFEKKDAKIMIVCPTSLIYNWKKEFDKFGSLLKYVVVADSKAKRLQVINDFDKYNIFITSYGLIRNDNDEYENRNFEVCIIDEAQAIKNYQAGMTREIKKIKARTKIALTGTPLENSILEIWSIFDFIMPGYLSSVHRFREIYGIHDVDDDSLSKLTDLNYQIKPFILRRKKIDVISDLPDKIEDNIYLDLPNKQRKLYLSVLKDSEREFNELIKSQGFVKARFKVLQLLMKLRQICVDPNILFNNYNGESIKMEKLLETVTNYVQDGHKILIFSSFKMVIDRVKNMFDNNGISSYMIAGDVKSKNRMELVDKFNNDDTNCFLITLKSGGTGLNLTSADVVIHLDIWWNPQVENQATDRTHRIGQTKKVSVIKFITRGTIEEKIIELQNKKKILSDSLIDGNDNSLVLSNLDVDDVRDLLSYGNE